MNRAQERHTGKLLTAHEACEAYSEHGGRGYVCLYCGNDVILVRSRRRTPHFKHRNGNNGFEDCENYLGLGLGAHTGHPTNSNRIPLEESWPDWTDPDKRSDGDTEAEEFRQAAFVIEGLRLVVYWETDPQESLDLIAVSTAHPDGSPEGSLARRLRSAGYLVGVFDGFSDAYLVTTMAEAGDRVALLGPKDAVDKQAGDLGTFLRQRGMEFEQKVANYPRLSGLPDGWAILTTTLPDDLSISDLPWIRSSPYSIRGGWAWRHRVYFPDAPPEIIRTTATDDSRWQVRRFDKNGRVDWVDVKDLHAEMLPAATFDQPGRYQVRIEGAEPCSLILEEPEWSSGEWIEHSTIEGGWHWQPDAWPVLKKPDMNSISRLFGALVENRFPERLIRNMPGIPENCLGRAWLQLAANTAIHPLETPIIANSRAFREHELYRHLRNIRGGRR